MIPPVFVSRSDSQRLPFFPKKTVHRAPYPKKRGPFAPVRSAPGLRRFSRGIRRKLGHPRDFRPPAFRHIRQFGNTLPYRRFHASFRPLSEQANVSSCAALPGQFRKRALPHPSRIFRRLRCFYCWSNFFTASEIARPSARPANCFVATPITLPMSDGAWAPTCSIMAFRALSSSASLI